MTDFIMFKHALGDFRMAKVIYNNRGQDDYAYIACGLLLTNCVEKTLKGFLEFTDANLTHNVMLDQLINQSMEYASKCVLTDWLKENYVTLSMCKFLACNPSNSSVDPEYIKNTITGVSEFLQVNSISETLVPEVSQDIKSAIMKRAPIGTKITEPLCWNILYRLYI